MEASDAQSQPYWHELEEIARQAREHRRLAPEARNDIVIRLCERSPLSIHELSVLLDRTEAYIGDAIRPLVNDGRLTFLYPDQPRHPRQKYLAAPPHAVVAVAPLTHPAAPQTIELVAVDFDPELEIPTPLIGRRPLGPSDPGAMVGAEVIPALPNQWVNVAIAVLAGVALSAVGGTAAWVIAVAVALGLSAWHVAVKSSQFRQFTALSATSAASVFVLVKSAVTFLEISAVLLAARAITGVR